MTREFLLLSSKDLIHQKGTWYNYHAQKILNQ
ncbi:MAG: hypothetical protein JWP45_3068 [Mucilaginibacter sp.]|nr:hypothetical protein [Mucilaginibacter sp.]